MKYPATQFETLKRALIIFREYFDILSVEETTLHYMIFQQFSEGQIHNHYYVNAEGNIKRHFQLTDFTGWSKMVDLKEPFELYPEGCNDNHIVTAMNKAFARIN